MSTSYNSPTEGLPFDADQMELWLTARLPDTQQRHIDDWLRHHPQHLRYWQALQQDQRALAQLQPPLEQRFLDDYDLKPSQATPSARRLRLPVMPIFSGFALGCLCTALALPFWTTTPSVQVQQPAFVQSAMQAHALYSVEVRHPVEVGGGEQAHLLTWLSKRLDRPLSAPDLSTLGFELLGGRLLPAADSPAAQLMYQDAGGERITLYIAAAANSQPSSFLFSEHRGLSTFYWVDSHWGYSLSGRIDRARLSQLSNQVYQALML
ncbi:anti-sigma factor family protein [Marinobacterium rhizophilum]|uniref:Anti-sigma factor n=1 Tax=Marinobacterium rhizophilum TaxID=420402 RepID=A0ABY5HND3_9GAMM|nr:anti-sigma factor [Marinobacterium rhizophilum]UTW13920.1 anti-sigma factor [Marinobacterium rhizophilum]